MQRHHRKYIEQLKNARGRGIPFQFTYEEWVEWWVQNLGKDWFKKRGARRGQYVMARKGDVGPYHPDNVYCELANLNCKHEGELCGTAKLTKSTVRKIYLAKGSITSVAKRFDTNYHTVWDIKTKRYWSHATYDLGVAPLHRQLTEDQVMAIYQSKDPYQVVAKKFGVGRSTVHDIWNGRRWQHVTVKCPPELSRQKVD